MDRKTILEIVDAHSGGLKGLELMTEIIRRIGIDFVNPERFFDQIEVIIGKEIPELGILRYAHKVDGNMFREKVFVYRKEPVCCEAHESLER